MRGEQIRRVAKLEQQGSNDRMSVTTLMLSDGTAAGEARGDIYQASIWGVEGKIHPKTNESNDDFYRRLQALDHLQKQPDDVSNQELADTLEELGASGRLRSYEPAEVSEFGVAVQVFD